QRVSWLEGAASIPATKVEPRKPDVSVIVPTRDSAEHLDRCLASIQEQRGVSVETLVVDQASRDSTREIARRAGAQVLELERPKLYAPPTRSRNVGAAAAQGEHLLHLDADMALTPGTLQSAVELCREGSCVAVTLEEIDIGEGFWSKSKALERRTYRSSSVLEGARFVSRSVFEQIGGYDETLGSGEDWDIHSRYANYGDIGRVP